MSLDARLVVGRKGERRNFPHSDTTGTNYSSNNDDSYNKMSNCEIPVKMNIFCAVSGGHGFLTESKFLGPPVSLSSTTPAYHRYLSFCIFPKPLFSDHKKCFFNCFFFFVLLFLWEGKGRE